jgi:hypothetical protein
MINKATLQGKEDLVKEMEAADQKQQQMQQQQMQVQMQELQARTELSHARSEADRGLAYERISRVQENHALAQKQVAEANKEDELALLNKVKILKELETIDLSHLQTLINLSNTMKVAEQSSVKPTQPLTAQEASMLKGRLNNLRHKGMYKMPKGNFSKERPTKHGLCDHQLYSLWDYIKQSCTNRNSSNWTATGSKGIEMFPEWSKNFISFYNWALENGWKEYSSIKRTDLSKDFSPTNCYFVEGKKRNFRIRYKKSSVRGVY